MRGLVHEHAAALTTPHDLARPPARSHADRLAALDDTAWGTLRLGPGWTDTEAEAEADADAETAGRTAAPRAVKEVRTP